MPTPISPSPVTDYRPEFLPAYVANGVVGLRVPRIPQIDGLASSTAFAGIDGASGAEGFARAPYPRAGDLEVDRVSLKTAPERAQLREQSYDFGRGELRTVFDFDVGDVRAELEVLTFCSRTMPMLVLQEVRVSVSTRVRFSSLTAGVDTKGIPGTLEGATTRTLGIRNNSHSMCSLRLGEPRRRSAIAGVAYVSELGGESWSRRSCDEGAHAPLVAPVLVPRALGEAVPASADRGRRIGRHASST